MISKEPHLHVKQTVPPNNPESYTQNQIIKGLLQPAEYCAERIASVISITFYKLILVHIIKCLIG